jgi:hypothetical protein
VDARMRCRDPVKKEDTGRTASVPPCTSRKQVGRRCWGGAPFVPLCHMALFQALCVVLALSLPWGSPSHALMLRRSGASLHRDHQPWGASPLGRTFPLSLRLRGGTDNAVDASRIRWSGT